MDQDFLVDRDNLLHALELMDSNHRQALSEVLPGTLPESGFGARNTLDLLAPIVLRGAGPGMDDGQRLELQIMHRRAHRGCQCRSDRALDLETQPQSSTYYQQIQFGTLMGSPVIGLLWRNAQLLHQLIDDETLPRCAELAPVVG